MASSRIVSDTGVYQKTVLPDGLRVISEKLPSVRSISLGVWVDVGSRHEHADENGISHLIEHMLFKGTKRRSAKEIAASLESIGGSINAFTSKEQTCYNARILDEHLEIAIDVLSDLTCHATLTTTNLEREKKVVCEEINETLETPSDLIHDIFAETYWGNHPLGRSILGQSGAIMKTPRASLVSYIKRNYRSGSVVVTAAGSVSHRKLVDLVKSKFSFEKGEAETYLTANRTRLRDMTVETNGNNQVHLCLGFPALEYNSKEKMAAMALSSYLGGGMSSVLFQKIREDKGLAYSVYTYLDMYRDAGLFGAYLATDKKNLKMAVKIALSEMEKLKRNRLSQDKLDKVKAQLKGQLTLSMESTAGRMNRLGRSELMTGKYTALKDILKAIDRVSSDNILSLANSFFDKSQIAVAVLGPIDKSALHAALD